MARSIKELRESTGMTQKQFSKAYDIPLSTLTKWEQGYSSPAPYVINLIARTLPSSENMMEKITDNNGHDYYYDSSQKSITDSFGNKIYISESLEGVKQQNLLLYLNDLYSDFYEILNRFTQDCIYDKEDDILWN